MHLRILTLIVAALIGLTACTTDDEPSPTATVDPITPTATMTLTATPTETQAATASPTSTPAPNDGANNPRTGDDDIDAVIEAIESADVDAVVGLVELMTIECTTAQGAGGPPKCQDGDAEGTEYSVIPLVTCEGEWIIGDDLEERLAMILDETGGLYAVVEAGSEDLPEEWPSSDHYVVFHRDSAEDAGVRFHVSEGDIVMIWQGCLAPPEELTNDPDGQPLEIVIGPFDSEV